MIMDKKNLKKNKLFFKLFLFYRRLQRKDSIDIKYNKKFLKIKDHFGYESRHIGTTYLLSQAILKLRPNIKKTKKFKIFSGDYYPWNKKIFAYCKTKDQDKIQLIPDFLFWGWPEVGIKDYDKTAEEMITLSKKPPKFNKLFWIGNVNTHETRKVLCELSKKDKRILAIGMGWKRNKVKALEELGATRYISIPDHCKYKYLIDVQGQGYSARLKLLLFSGRPLFIAERKWKEFFFDKLEPYVHYIPVKEDLSDLIEQLDWAEKNPSESKKIATNAQEFAKLNLTRQKAIEYFANVLGDRND